MSDGEAVEGCDFRACARRAVAEAVLEAEDAGVLGGGGLRDVLSSGVSWYCWTR